MTPVMPIVGEIDLNSADILRDRLNQAGRQYEGRVVVLDLTNMTFIDSTGLGVLVGALRRFRASGGDLRLAGCRAGIARVLTIAGLDRIFESAATVQDACDQAEAEAEPAQARRG